MQNRAWYESRTSILEAMQCNLVKSREYSVGSFRLVTRRGEDATEMQSMVEVCRRAVN